MQRASDLFDETERGRIEAAVAEAESKTSCEIVPVVATASGRYDRAEDMVGLWLAVIAAVAVWWWFPRQPDVAGGWDGMPTYAGAIAMVGGIVLAFVAGAVAGSRITWLRRLFTPRRQMQDEVARRAREVFFDQRVHHTRDATGVLIYLSLFEHIAVVLGDREVVEKLGQPFLDGLCKQLTEELHEGNAADALCHVIAEAGAQLAKPLPRSEDDVNELNNVLVMID